MIRRESEQPIDLSVPHISPKTSSEQLKIWAKERWQSDARKRVAADIVNNGKELLAGSNIDWELVLGRIRAVKVDDMCYGEDAIAVNDARIIGGVGAVTDLPMHNPPMVYLSVKCLADRVKSSRELEDFERIMLEGVVYYGQKVLPHANLYTETLDFLLGVENRRRQRNSINKIKVFLRDRKVEDAYEVVRSCNELVRRRT